MPTPAVAVGSTRACVYLLHVGTDDLSVQNKLDLSSGSNGSSSSELEAHAASSKLNAVTASSHLAAVTAVSFRADGQYLACAGVLASSTTSPAANVCRYV